MKDEENNLIIQRENKNNMENNDNSSEFNEGKIVEAQNYFSENKENNENFDVSNYVTFNDNINNINNEIDLENSDNKNLMDFSYYNNIFNK